MKIFLKVVLLSLLFSGCEESGKPSTSNKFSAVIKHIVVSKEIETGQFIYFAVEFTNDYNNTMVLNGNSIEKHWSNGREFERFGVMLETDGKKTPLPSLIPEEGVYYVNAHSKATYVFIYSSYYSHDFNYSFLHEDYLKKVLPKLQLNYLGNRTMNNGISCNNPRGIFNYSDCDERLSDSFIIKNKATVEFRDNYSFDEVLALGGITEEIPTD